MGRSADSTSYPNLIYWIGNVGAKAGFDHCNDSYFKTTPVVGSVTLAYYLHLVHLVDDAFDEIGLYRNE